MEDKEKDEETYPPQGLLSVPLRLGDSPSEICGSNELTLLPSPKCPSVVDTHSNTYSFSRSQSSDLDTSLWSNLPEELNERILAHLPINSFFRFRSVCKSWNSCLYSDKFLRLHLEALPWGPWFYLLTYDEGINGSTAYDPQQNKWFRLSLPDFPRKGVVLPVASAGGLICFLDVELHHLFVVNPLIRSCSEVPSRRIKWWSRKAVGMVLLNDNNHDVSSSRCEGLQAYKLVWLDSSGDYEVYDSAKNEWRSGFLPRTLRLPLSLNFPSHPINASGVLHFLRTRPDGLVLYDAVKNTWDELRVPLPPSCFDNVLAECKGRVLMVGLFAHEGASFICVWELQRMTWLWKEVDRMPCLAFFEFSGGKQIHMSCLGNKGSVLLSLRCKQLSCLVLYDLAKRHWLKVPPSSDAGSGSFVGAIPKQQWIAWGMSFQPSLNTPFSSQTQLQTRYF